MNILVTGGAGFVGAVLTPYLLERGHTVTVLDTLYFGNTLTPHTRLTVRCGDIRNPMDAWDVMENQNAVIHLAALSNDESVNANEDVAKSINLDALPFLLHCSRAAGVERFVLASTSAVYGPSDAISVTEDHPLNPEWRYAKLKAESEPVALAQSCPDFAVTVVRPAALCGYSPRPRLDLTVNILTTHAVQKGVIQVWGGAQSRCSLHVRDMARAYLAILTAPVEDVAGETFNVGSDNHTVAELAKIVQSVVTPTPVIDVSPARDHRSYRITSDKIARALGWIPSFEIEDAVRDLERAFHAGLLPNPFTDDRYYNARQMARLAA